MSDLKEIFVNTQHCTGCLSCKLACAVQHSKNKDLFSALSQDPKPKSRLYVEWLWGNTKVPVLCRHCEDAPCVNACISGAITRAENNAVITNTDKCIGCWTCVMVCPYGVIGRDKDLKIAYRCDRCPDQDHPACVDACPTEALTYATVDKFSAEKRQAASREVAQGQGG
ncbi:MAG: 4Fe-4S dicluster domain-containing protein [Desulfobacteraceae bacterium]|nr:4Fe-4S dicluster domain-containing protein [Desulfobacteraceae bacterium]